MKLEAIKYKELNSRQKETYNFQKLAGLLADYGYAAIKLNDDWNGADFIAQHINGLDYIKVQLKSRLTFDKKYKGKNLYIAFPHKGDWYLFLHDELLQTFLTTFNDSMGQSSSWQEKGLYTWNSLSHKILALLSQYRIRKV